MAERVDGTPVREADAHEQWALAAHRRLIEVAAVYNRTITYTELAADIQRTTGITTRKLLPNWIGRVLERTAELASELNQPAVTSLCVRNDGTIGHGYLRAPRASPRTLDRVEDQAALDRLRCYEEFTAEMPIDGGRPTFTPEVALAMREGDAWIADILDRGVLRVGDRVPFRTHVEVARLFGKFYDGHQQATIELGANVDVWFPKMYPNGDWNNSLTSDGLQIEMRPRENGRFAHVMQQRNRDVVIAFGHLKARRGRPYYAFLGVFHRALELSNDEVWIHRRLSDVIEFDGEGGYSFTTSSPTVDDDVLAERSPFDARLVAELERRFAVGDFAVEDRFANSKTRGSAQAVFARHVKENFGWMCAVTGIATREFLVASHIVPWSRDSEIRLDPSNGICLSTFVDRAFDAGYLAITPDLRTEVRWDRVGMDEALRLELERLDDVVIASGRTTQPDAAKLRRRATLGY